jgi:hypothetical protein
MENRNSKEPTVRLRSGLGKYLHPLQVTHLEERQPLDQSRAQIDLASEWLAQRSLAVSSVLGSHSPQLLLLEMNRRRCRALQFSVEEVVQKGHERTHKTTIEGRF